MLLFELKMLFQSDLFTLADDILKQTSIVITSKFGCSPLPRIHQFEPVQNLNPRLRIHFLVEQLYI